MSRLLAALLGTALLAAGLAAPATGATGTARVAADFDGDGYGDLAVGAPTRDGGSVVVLYGSATGLGTAGAQRWTQDSAGIPGSTEVLDQFGAALAAGDFDGDGYSDLAIGAPDEDKDTESDGVVHVVYGSRSGLTAAGTELWWPGAPGVPGVPAYLQHFGSALAAGDVNGDGRDDLAVGGRGDSWERDIHYIEYTRGAVWVLTGARDGLRPGTTFAEPSEHVSGQFGHALAIGDFDGDRFGDLAVGAPSFGGGPGSAWVYRGSTAGVSATRRVVLDQDAPGVVGTAENGDRFGYALAAGDLDGDGRDDLAVGAPGEDVGAATDAGAVTVLYGSGTGLTGSRSQLWHQDVAGVPGVAEQEAPFENQTERDYFGWAVAVADHDGDGRADLAVGAPYANTPRDDNRRFDSGSVTVLRGAAGGVTTARAQYWHQDVAGVPNAAEPGDQFGAVLSPGDFDGNRRADLAVGVPYEGVTITRGGTLGAVNVLYAAASGLGTAGADFWHLDVPGVPGFGHVNFGSALAG